MRKILTIDPGIMGTGWAFFSNLERGIRRPPDLFGVDKCIQTIGWQRKCVILWETFEARLIQLNPDRVFIEFPEVWLSAKSHASAASGDLFKLTYLVGGFGLLCEKRLSKEPILLAPREWKGQLPKEVVIQRIKEAYPSCCDAIGNHEADAVGMGLSLQGLL